ncbi:iron chelate uptake ABC transporter family permease subunit [Saccharomonospora sp. NPDC046836]|uniref:iron chelate uptake ABC transporter family permease subunit n=1 Tax=Saccharomonospora sp. NPDC046836 TaxID=3156921 RepID=UPI0033E8DAB7
METLGADERSSVTASVDRSATDFVRARRHRVAVLLLGVLLLIGACALSLVVGSKEIPWRTVWEAVGGDAGSPDHLIVQDMRIPRTLLGVVVGVALGISGALVQAMTRNPLADTGVLGVNAGAAFFVAVAIGVLGLSGISTYVWAAFLGALLITALVYALGSVGRGGGTPIRLTLAGVAVGAALSGLTSGLMLLDPEAFDAMRSWNAGSLVGRDLGVTASIVPFVLLGLVLAAAIAAPLNSMALGDDVARAQGVSIGLVRVIGIIAVTLLCGAATAAAGPIGFVGLMIPHVARWIAGPDQRWIMVYTLVASPLLVLLSDVLGRLVVRPGEMPVGIVTAFLGAPVLIVMVRRRKASGL